MWRKKVGLELQYVEPKNENGVEFCVIEPVDVEEDLVYWRQAVVCYVMGANPLFPVANGFFRRIWKHHAIDKVLMLKKGIFLVRFQDV